MVPRQEEGRDVHCLQVLLLGEIHCDIELIEPHDGVIVKAEWESSETREK